MFDEFDALREIEAWCARQNLSDYIAALGLGIVPAAHHRLMISHLEAVERGEIPNLMMMLPPGAGKSSYSSILFPAWYLGRNPANSVIAASHTDELAESFGRRVRNLVDSAEHRNIFGIGVAQDNSAASRWATEAGGEYFAVGVGAAVAGRRADLGLVDDPVRSREDADSETRRNRVWEWYKNDFWPRLKPHARQIIVSTRWHEDDLVGRLLAPENREYGPWQVLELPMEALPRDPLGRRPGERLWPEWFTPQQVAAAKADARAWNALYQQQPAAEEGDYFKLGWFGTFDNLPPLVHRYGASDYAVTEGGGDFTEHGVFAADPLGNVYIVDWWRGQANADEWIERQCDMIIRHEPLCWFGEAGPIRRAVEPYLIRRMTERGAPCRIEWLPSIHDKPIRCRSFQALASNGRVMLPQQAVWKADLLGQLSRFPAGRFDDGVDVCSLFGRGLEVVKPPRIRRAVAERPRPMPMSSGPSGGWMAA